MSEIRERITSVSTYDSSANEGQGAWNSPVPIGAETDNIDISTSVSTTGTGELNEGEELNSAAVKVTSSDTETGAWSKFNKFVNRVATNLGNFTGKVVLNNYNTDVGNNDLYSASVLNNYMANIIGITGTTLPSGQSNIVNRINDKVSKSGDTITGGLTVQNQHVTLKSSVADTAASTIPSDVSMIFKAYDKNDKYASYLETIQNTNGNISLTLAARRIYNNTNVTNSLKLETLTNGTKSVTVSDPDKWRTAIGALSTSPSSLELIPSSNANNGGFIDFHYNGSSADYTSRIIESSSGTLKINNTYISTDETIHGTASTTREQRIGTYTQAGKLYLYSAAAANGNRGLYAIKGTASKGIIVVDSSNNATFYGTLSGNASSASTATKLTTARSVQVNLASTAAPTFDGSSNLAPGVTGILGLSNGGTGSTGVASYGMAQTIASETSPFTIDLANAGVWGYMVMLRLRLVNSGSSALTCTGNKAGTITSVISPTTAIILPGRIEGSSDTFTVMIYPTTDSTHPGEILVFGVIPAKKSVTFSGVYIKRM